MTKFSNVPYTYSLSRSEAEGKSETRSGSFVLLKERAHPKKQLVTLTEFWLLNNCCAKVYSIACRKSIMQE